MPATMETRRKLAGDILALWDNNQWDASESTREIAQGRFAVVVQRDEDSWVVGADSAEDIASIILSTYTQPEYTVEWVEGVYDLDDDGNRWPYESSLAVTVNGVTVTV
jgi:hypothetical protein